MNDEYDSARNNALRGIKIWPEAGDKIIFKGVPEFLFPNYTNVRENANNKLCIGKEYIVHKCEVYSSWCAVFLDDFPDDNMFFHLQMFKYEVD